MVKADKTYEVTVTREGSDFLGEVEGLPGAHTFADSEDALLKEMRDVVILAADLPDDAHFNLEIRRPS